MRAGALAVVAVLLCVAGCTSGSAKSRDAVTAQDASPTTAPAEAAKGDVARVIRRGVEYLVTTQNPNGSWGTGLETRGFEVYSMVPGTHDAMRVATTALCVMALREAGEIKAHGRGVEYLVHHGQARRDAGPLLYNVWAHTYALQALSLELRADATSRGLRDAAAWHLDRLVRYETDLGGWNYYDFVAQTQRPSMGATSFGTAAALVALWEARRAGLDVPQKLIDRAIRRLEEMQLPSGAYLYSFDLRYYPQLDGNKLRGSVGRTQAGNFGLWLWESPRVDAARARDGLELFFREHNYIAMGRKRQYPHESWYMTAPYYYYFGHYYAARVMGKLGPDGVSAFGTQLAEKIVPFQEPDGSWWDYAMWDYHKPYGTAFALMTLLRRE